MHTLYIHQGNAKICNSDGKLKFDHETSDFFSTDINNVFISMFTFDHRYLNYFIFLTEHFSYVKVILQF